MHTNLLYMYNQNKNFSIDISLSADSLCVLCTTLFLVNAPRLLKQFLPKRTFCIIRKSQKSATLRHISCSGCKMVLSASLFNST